MTMRGRLWQDERDQLLENERPGIVVDRVAIQNLPDGTFEITVEGQGLHGAIRQPRVEVGGIRLTNLRFEQDGRVLKGTANEKPHSQTVVVDYGFARAKTER